MDFLCCWFSNATNTSFQIKYFVHRKDYTFNTHKSLTHFFIDLKKVKKYYSVPLSIG